jgi:hypothetical protein
VTNAAPSGSLIWRVIEVFPRVHAGVVETFAVRRSPYSPPGRFFVDPE